MVDSSFPLVHDCIGLDPEMNYTIFVSAVNGAGEGINASLAITTACTPPSLPNFQQANGDTFRITVATDNRDCTVRYILLCYISSLKLMNCYFQQNKMLVVLNICLELKILCTIASPSPFRFNLCMIMH